MKLLFGEGRKKERETEVARENQGHTSGGFLSCVMRLHYLLSVFILLLSYSGKAAGDSLYRPSFFLQNGIFRMVGPGVIDANPELELGFRYRSGIRLGRTWALGSRLGWGIYVGQQFTETDYSLKDFARNQPLPGYAPSVFRVSTSGSITDLGFLLEYRKPAWKHFDLESRLYAGMYGGQSIHNSQQIEYVSYSHYGQSDARIYLPPASGAPMVFGPTFSLDVGISYRFLPRHAVGISCSYQRFGVSRSFLPAQLNDQEAEMHFDGQVYPVRMKFPQADAFRLELRYCYKLER